MIQVDYSVTLQEGSSGSSYFNMNYERINLYNWSNLARLSIFGALLSYFDLTKTVVRIISMILTLNLGEHILKYGYITFVQSSSINIIYPLSGSLVQQMLTIRSYSSLSDEIFTLFSRFNFKILFFISFSFYLALHFV